MNNIDLLLYILDFVLLILAGFSVSATLAGRSIRFEWLAQAPTVLTFIV